MEETQINLLEYDYTNDAKVEIPGKMLYGIMQLLKQVKENETIPSSFISQYPKKHKEIFSKTDKKHLEKVEVEWETYKTAESFFNQTPVEAVSILGAMATDLLLLTQQVHLDNIKNGVALKVGTFKEDTDAVKLS